MVGYDGPTNIAIMIVILVPTDCKGWTCLVRDSAWHGSNEKYDASFIAKAEHPPSSRLTQVAQDTIGVTKKNVHDLVNCDVLQI